MHELFILRTSYITKVGCAHNSSGTPVTPSPTTCCLFELRMPELLTGRHRAYEDAQCAPLHVNGWQMLSNIYINEILSNIAY